jgi:hypothetical protein
MTPVASLLLLALFLLLRTQGANERLTLRAVMDWPYRFARWLWEVAVVLFYVTLVVGIPLSLLYLLVRFVKFAWVG